MTTKDKIFQYSIVAIGIMIIVFLALPYFDFSKFGFKANPLVISNVPLYGKGTAYCRDYGNLIANIDDPLISIGLSELNQGVQKVPFREISPGTQLVSKLNERGEFYYWGKLTNENGIRILIVTTKCTLNKDDILISDFDSQFLVK